MYVNGVNVLVHTQGDNWRVDNSALQSPHEGLCYCQTKDLEDELDVIAKWGSIVQGTDTGDGWLQMQAIIDFDHWVEQLPKRERDIAIMDVDHWVEQQPEREGGVANETTEDDEAKKMLMHGNVDDAVPIKSSSWQPIPRRPDEQASGQETKLPQMRESSRENCEACARQKCVCQ